MITTVCGLMLFGLLGLSWLTWTWWRRWPPQVAAIMASMQRLLRPWTPDDCPACRQQATGTTRAPRPCLPVRPWHEVKSRRGKPKRIASAGVACPAPTCPYYRITDAQVHALVGDGRHGKHERIQSFRCQACGTTFSARRHTALYRLKTTSYRIAEVLTALAEGLDVAAATRVFGQRHATITRWGTRAGRVPSGCSATLHGRWVRNLYMPHLQLDELRTRLRRRAQVLWIWVTVDPSTKIIPVLHLGPRTQDVAHTVVHKLRQQLAPTCTPIFSSDGLDLYFYALTAHFGQGVEGVGRRTRQWQVAAELIYGQLKKTYQRRKVVRVTRLMRCGS